MNTYCNTLLSFQSSNLIPFRCRHKIIFTRYRFNLTKLSVPMPSTLSYIFTFHLSSRRRISFYYHSHLIYILTFLMKYGNLKAMVWTLITIHFIISLFVFNFHSFIVSLKMRDGIVGIV
jgi:hypothetical protein